eukprot:3898533-Alexandrium_andersonii.AAC.1
MGTARRPSRRAGRTSSSFQQKWWGGSSVVVSQGGPMGGATHRSAERVLVDLHPVALRHHE